MKAGRLSFLGGFINPLPTIGFRCICIYTFEVQLVYLPTDAPIYKWANFHLKLKELCRHCHDLVHSLRGQRLSQIRCLIFFSISFLSLVSFRICVTKKLKERKKGSKKERKIDLFSMYILSTQPQLEIPWEKPFKTGRMMSFLPRHNFPAARGKLHIVP